MLLTLLHDEPLIHVFHFLHGRDICKLEVTCRRFRQLSYLYDHVAWKHKCKILWQNKIRSLVRMNEDIVLPIGFFDIRNPAVLDDLFEKTHVPLHEKVLAFKEVFNMKDSTKLMDKIKKFPKRRRLDVSSEDGMKLEPSWKTLYTLDYLTEKFQGNIIFYSKYISQEEGTKIVFISNATVQPIYSPEECTTYAQGQGSKLPMFWGVGNADEIYYIIKERPEPSRRSRTNSLTYTTEDTTRSRGRSNSVGGEYKPSTADTNMTSDLSISTSSIPIPQTLTNSRLTTNPQAKIINITTTSYTSTTHHHNSNTTTTTTTTTSTTTLSDPLSLSNSSSSTSTSQQKNSSSNSKNPLSTSLPSATQLEAHAEDKNPFARTMLLPLGQLYPNEQK